MSRGFGETPPTRIGIGLVTLDFMHAMTTDDLIHLHAYTLQLGHEVLYMRQEGTLLASQRMRLTRLLLQKGAEWLFFVDSDMVVPKNAIDGLIRHDLPVVAANCVRRKRPISPTARKRSGFLNGDGESVLVYTTPESTGLEQVETVGLGVMLIHRSVFEQMSTPWFDTPWQPDQLDPATGEKGLHCGEDIYFCARCKELGIPIYVDHDLSKAVRHIGSFDFGHDNAIAEAEQVARGEWDEPKPLVEVVN